MTEPVIAWVPGALKKKFQHKTSSPVPTGLLIAALVTASVACNLGEYLPSRDTSETVSEAEASMSLAQALAASLEDRRQTILEQMGSPDVFLIQFEDLEGQVVRSEQWSYLDFESRFDFIDGELLWTIELEPVPDGSIYAHYYDPMQFEAYMSSAQVRQMLAPQELYALDLAEADIAGGSVLAGDQIILGFEQDRLVYVETFMLSPEAGS